MPAEPVPLRGRVKGFAVANTCRRRSLVASRRARNSGSRCPRTGRARACGHLGIGIGGTRAHQQAVGNRHRRIVADPRSPAPTRPRQLALPVDCPRGTGSLCAPGPSRPPPRCRPRPGPLRPSGCSAGRSGAPASSSRGPTPRPLHLVMVIAGEPPPETVQTLHALQQQTSAHWTLTVVVRNSWQTAFTALLGVSGLQRTSQRVRVESTDDAAAPAHMLEPRIGRQRRGARRAALPGRRLGPRCRGAAGQPLSPSGCRLRRRGLRDRGRGARGSPAQAGLFARIPPVVLLRREAAGHRFGRSSSTPARRAAACPSSNTIWPCGPARGRARSSISPRSCAIGASLRPTAPAAPAEPDVGHVADALRRRGEVAEVTAGPAPGHLPGPAAAVGTGDDHHHHPLSRRAALHAHLHRVDRCHAGHGTVDFVLVDNGSVQPETQTLVERLARRDDVQVVADGRPFNWSALNNAAVALARGDVLLFLNNDIEARQPGWLDVLAAQAMRPDVGAVGARLLYPDGRLQHCGVVIGVGGAADHLLAGLDGERAGLSQHGDRAAASAPRSPVPAWPPAARSSTLWADSTSHSASISMTSTTACAPSVKG